MRLALLVLLELITVSCFHSYLKGVTVPKKRVPLRLRGQTRPPEFKVQINDQVVTNRVITERSRFKRSLKQTKDLSGEIEEVKIVPVTPDGIPVIHCVRLHSGIVSCRQNEFQYNIKIKNTDITDESLVSLVRSLYRRLAGIGDHGKRRRRQLPITLPPQLQRTPLIVILPPTEQQSGSCQEVTTVWPFTRTCYECPLTTDRVRPIDCPFRVECCPVDFEPRSIEELSKNIDCEDNAFKSTKAPNAFVYSCKWQGKRNVQQEVFEVPLDPLALKF